MGALGGSGGYGGDKTLQLPVMETLRRAWADDDLRARIIFVLSMFAVFCFGAHVPVPIPGITADELVKAIQDNQFFQMMNALGGGALRRVSIFALGLNPYITASIILQILTTAIPQWKQELKEGGEYARKHQNQRTRALSVVLCIFQGWGLLQLIMKANGPDSAIAHALTYPVIAEILVFWTPDRCSCSGSANSFPSAASAMASR